MAPLIAHLVIAERIWPRLAQQWKGAYSGFLFGTLATDADKFCPELEQPTTHLIGKDGTDAWLTQRSRRFIERQTELLQAPFADLGPSEQAFALGYLCHLAADEATASRYVAFRDYRAARMGSLPADEAIATAVDERAATLLRDRSETIAILETSRIPTGLFPFIPRRCLHALRWIVFPLVRDGGGFESYIRLVRRNQLWHRHRQTSDEPVDADLEEKLAVFREHLLACEEEARSVASEFDFASTITATVDHCWVRLAELALLA